jgi:hypothetical protein
MPITHGVGYHFHKIDANDIVVFFPGITKVNLRKQAIQKRALFGEISSMTSTLLSFFRIPAHRLTKSAAGLQAKA